MIEVVLVALVVVMAYRPAPRPDALRHEVVYRVPTSEKVVALTFDDGPDPDFTPAIVDLLDKHKVKATFFMVGKQMMDYPELVKDVLTHGNAIGNHTYDHPHDIEADSSAQVIRELDQCEQIIENMTGSRAQLFRPPRGLVNGTVLSIADDEGYRTILWTVSADHHDAPTPELMAKRVLDHIRPGAIILAHDGTFKSRWKDVQATPLIIQELKKRGYRFVTVPELLATGRSDGRS